MKSVFASAIASLWKANQSNIDNFVFRLHYKWTVLLLLAFTVVVTARQYLGDPINCMTPNSERIPEKLLNGFCWTSSTFSVKGSWTKVVGTEVVYPGIDKRKNGSDQSENLVYHTYYQWVCFFLFIQSLLFYVPRYFWKNLEGRRMKQLSLGLIEVTTPDENRDSDIKTLVKYMERQRKKHNLYFLGFVLAEICNFVNALGQMFMVDHFLGGKFMSYGLDVMRHSNWTSGIHHNPMVEVFPRLTKCTFYNFGPSGDVQSKEVMCFLAINIINEKIFLFLWFWFCFLIIMASSALLYRLMILIFPPVRLMVLRTRACHAKVEDLDILVRGSNVGDWFVLNMLAKNIDALNFRDFVAEYVKTTFDQNGNLE